MQGREQGFQVSEVAGQAGIELAEGNTTCVGLIQIAIEGATGLLVAARLWLAAAMTVHFSL